GLAPLEKRGDGGFFGVLLAQDCEAGKISGLVNATKEAGIAVVPTQTLMTRWLSPKAPELMVQEPEMAYIPAAQRFSWRQSKQQMLDRLDYSDATYDQFLELRMDLLRQFRDAGVPILLGSDAPQVFNVPGFSIHHEMESMIDAGLSTAEVLASGTIHVARFFNADDRGLVAEGKVADLLLLAANPLENISHAAQIEAVIYRGNLLTKDQIENQLKTIAARHKTE
ncbi:MAG: amidohydrolase family protein, partial [Saprospiraceae bacterium]|nr:amidohydrolase family protein [Saprospiraceae bacterium]